MICLLVIEMFNTFFNSNEEVYEMAVWFEGYPRVTFSFEIFGGYCKISIVTYITWFRANINIHSTNPVPWTFGTSYQVVKVIPFYLVLNNIAYRTLWNSPLEDQIMSIDYLLIVSILLKYLKQEIVYILKQVVKDFKGVVYSMMLLVILVDGTLQFNLSYFCSGGSVKPLKPDSSI